MGYNGARMVSDMMDWPSIQANCLTFDILVFLKDINLGLGIFRQYLLLLTSVICLFKLAEMGQLSVTGTNSKADFFVKIQVPFCPFQMGTCSFSFLPIRCRYTSLLFCQKKYSKALRCTFFGEWKNWCSLKFVQLELLNKANARTPKNRAV